MKRIGMVGLGTMGAGIAANLLAKGFELTVFARDAAKSRPWADRGARVVDTPAALGGHCDAVILSVSDTHSVEQVLFGERGIAAGAGGIRYVIDTSTISAEGTRGFAAQLAQQGIALLDAPVSGGPKGANDGTLAVMVGGTQEAFDACLPVLQAFGKNIRRIGESGAGQICKACNQVCVVANVMGVVEMISLCRRNGIDPMVVRDIILAGTGRSGAMEMQAAKMLEGNFSPAGFRADLLLKDLRIAQALERDSGAFGGVTGLAEPLFAKLVEEEGKGALDWTAVSEMVMGQ